MYDIIYKKTDIQNYDIAYDIIKTMKSYMIS